MVSVSPLLGTGLIVVALLALSAFFSSSEIAVFSLPPEWFETAGETAGNRGATLARLREDPHRLLVTLLVGNNVVNVALSSVVTAVLVAELPSSLAIPAATVGVSAVLLLFGEILPKAYGLGNAESVALRAALPIRIVGTVLFPVVIVFDLITRGVSDATVAEEDIERPYTDVAPGEESR